MHNFSLKEPLLYEEIPGMHNRINTGTPLSLKRFFSDNVTMLRQNRAFICKLSTVQTAVTTDGTLFFIKL